MVAGHQRRPSNPNHIVAPKNRLSPQTRGPNTGGIRQRPRGECVPRSLASSTRIISSRSVCGERSMTEWTVRSSVLHASLWNTMTTLVRGRLSGYSLFLHLQRETRGEKGTFLVSQLACDPPQRQTRAKTAAKDTRGGRQGSGNHVGDRGDNEPSSRCAITSSLGNLREEQNKEESQF